MQNQNWRFLSKAIAVAAVTVLVVSLSTFAAAQAGEDVHAMFAAAAKEQTNVAGVSIIADRPKGFNPLTATNGDLGRYGLPQRPDKQADPKGYAQWQTGMRALKYRPSAHVEAKPYSSTNLRMAKQPATEALSAIPTQWLSYNWSGVANTNSLTSWNNKTSFNFITSVWNVPAAQPPFGACANGITGPFYEVSWNGIDGFSNGDVIQGGSLSTADCSGNVGYIGWVEWYPSYPILALYCGSGPCPVNAGDDFWVITYGANSGYQFVFVEDITQGWGGTLELTWLTGPFLVGGSEEQIVERPCCNGDGYPLALTNYIYDFFSYSFGYNGKGTQFYAGQQTAATAIITMVDDGNTQDISRVGQGSQGEQGKYSLWFFDENCAQSGGCTPK